ncbi:helix-turn-helix transcriptional regulator [Streptomyces nigrescens]
MAVTAARMAQNLAVDEVCAELRNSASGAACNGFLKVRDAAEYLGLSPHTLYVWRHRRQGPPSFRMGPRGRVMYRREALDAWIHEQEQADSRSNPTLSPLAVGPEYRSGHMLDA